MNEIKRQLTPFMIKIEKVNSKTILFFCEYKKLKVLSVQVIISRWIFYRVGYPLKYFHRAVYHSKNVLSRYLYIYLQPFWSINLKCLHRDDVRLNNWWHNFKIVIFVEYKSFYFPELLKTSCIHKRKNWRILERYIASIKSF